MSQKIFFHVGLSKTGSTFLQHQVFPKIKNIHYLPTKKYRHSLDLIPKMKDERILISREFDQQFEQEIKKFSQQYPNAFPIIVFREHSSWAVSNYKRFVKNGHPITLKEFIDIEKDNGLFKLKDFHYQRYLDLLNQHFKSPTLVLFYEDLKNQPKEFVQQILDFTETSLDFDHVNWNPKHVSYDENSLKLVRELSNKIQFQKKLEVHIKPKGFLYNLYANIIRYSILYGSKILPNSFFPKHDLVDKKEVLKLKEHFSEEWTSLRNSSLF